MAAGSTYSQIASTTLGSTASSVTFSSIPQTYTNLVLVTQHTLSSGTNNQLVLRFNSDTGSNYSFTVVEGTGSSASSTRSSSQVYAYLTYTSSTTDPSTAITHIPQYNNTSTYKSLITRSNGPAANLGARVNLWRSTAAITQIDLSVYLSGVLAAGSTFTLYGIRGA